MKSVVVEEFGTSDALRVVESALPHVGPEDVLVRVAGAGLNWIDVSLRAGRLAAGGLTAPAPRYGMGWDVAGIVESVGAQVTRHRPGDRIIGLRDVLGAPGTHAEYVALHQDAVTAAPAGADLVDAGGFPLAGVTALGALATSGASRDDTVLVTGAGGVIGTLCVSIAVSRGMEVTAVGRGLDADRLTALGVNVVDGDPDAVGATLASRVRALVPRGVDAVIDTANLGIAAHEALRGGGTFVALVRPFAPPPLRGTAVRVHEAWADPALLAEAVALVDTGVIELPRTRRLPLTLVAEAHDVMEAGGLRGRIVLVP